MGTTSEKLTYLNTTKQKLKQAINNIGGEVTDETTFRQYANQLQNVYDNLPKTEYQEGTEVNLGVTSKGKLDYENGVVGIGQSSQETTTGKNLWGGFDRSTTGVVTFTNYKNGTMKVNGTNDTSGTLFSMTSAGATNYLITLEAGTYTISGGSTNVGISVVNSTGGTLASCNDTPATFTTNGVSIFVRASVNVGVSVNNETLYVQLEKNSSATAWEPYTNGASPNPSYPQTINSVTGNQDVVVKDGNNNTIATYQLSLGDIELCGIGNYKDELIYDADEDRVYKKAYFGERTLNGTENWTYYTASTNLHIIFLDFANLTYDTSNYNFKMENFLAEEGKCYFTNVGRLHFYLENMGYYSMFPDKASWTTFLGNNNQHLVYQLSEPVLTEITDTTLKAQVKAWYYAQSLDGTTIIEGNGDLPMIIKVRGLKGE